MPIDPQQKIKGSTAESVSLGFGNLSVSVGDHIGQFYQTRDEWRAVLIPFLKTGLESGDKCVYLVGPDDGKREIHEALAAVGIETAGLLDSGQLILERFRSSFATATSPPPQFMRTSPRRTRCAGSTRCSLGMGKVRTRTKETAASS